MYLCTCCWDVVPWGLQGRILHGNTTGHLLEGERRERGGREEGEANRVTLCHPTDSNNVKRNTILLP